MAEQLIAENNQLNSEYQKHSHHMNFNEDPNLRRVEDENRQLRSK